MANQILNDKLHWYKDAIIYELHIKAFRDSNGDGIGDFGGLLEKLDYLQELGVTAIWVLPFYPSPLRDDGYDIADYYAINPRYGNLDQFKQFLDETHKRGLKVITELVINHTSDQHPWFQRARTAPKGSPERNYYVWTDNPNDYKDVRIIFQDFETSNWTWDPVAQQYYWHRFFHHQPDLNYDNPQVQEEIFNILDYWCAMGVDGFRLDAVPYLFEREGTNGENLPETHAFLKKLRKHIDGHFPGTVFLAEANMWPEDSASYFGDGDECHMNYHFPVMPRMFMALQQEDRYPITDIFDQTPEIPETCQWAMFLRNHDELTLEMVTDEERDFMYKVYAKDPKAKINLGIRHRLAPLMDGNRRKIELMNSLLFSLPGTPVIYYGDEIGMGDNFYLGDRDGVRTPMQWSSDRNAGFSEANPHTLYLPLILDPEYYYEAVNVELQRRNTSSLFWYMKRIINMRKSSKSFSRGDMKFLQVENPKVLAFTRSYEQETLLVIVNLSKYSQPAEVNLKNYKGYMPVEVFSKNRFPAVQEETPYFFTLGPHSYQWFRLEKTASSAETKRELANLSLESWEDLLSPQFTEVLERDILPAYLTSRSWFAGKQRMVYSISIAETMSIPSENDSLLFLLIDVAYNSGLPETYQLAVTFVQQTTANQLQQNCPEAVIAQMRLDGEVGILCDAFYLKGVQKMLFDYLAKGDSLLLQGGSLSFNCNHLGKAEEGSVINSRIHEGSEQTTSINYNNSYFLKMYRKVEAFVNPDVELTRFLSEEVRFKNTPAFKGTIEWNTAKGTTVLGMMQELVENHGNGYDFMQERVSNFIERVLARNAESLSELSIHMGSLAEPVGYDELPQSLQVLIGGRVAEQARLLGIRTGELHKALSEKALEKEFVPEEFSLHYQRSLFSSMQSLVREAYDIMAKPTADLPPELEAAIKDISNLKDELLRRFRRIYEKKLDILKIRNHGNLTLKNVLLTGKDLYINDFGGNGIKTFSERRLKRSPIRDIALMITDIYNVMFEGFYFSNHIGHNRLGKYLPYGEQWAYYISNFFLKAYIETVKDSAFLPKDQDERKMVLQVYLLERVLKQLNSGLQQKSMQALIPLRLVDMILME